MLGMESCTVTAILACSAPPSADSSTVTAILECSAPPSADSSTDNCLYSVHKFYVSLTVHLCNIW